MTYTLLLEATGAVFSIFAAYSMSISTKENTRPLYLAFISFFISNLALITFFTVNGKVPIIIQMLLFFATSILGIYKHTLHKRRDVLLMSVVIFFYIIVLFFNNILDFRNTDFGINGIDLLASCIAIIGSFLLSSHNYKRRGLSFICFFVADMIFVYIGYENQFYFFMVQSLFYLYTSVNGYRNTMLKKVN